MQGSVDLAGNVSMRLAGPADKQFLEDLFHDTRSFIYDHSAAEHDYKRMVVEHQHSIRNTGYENAFPNAFYFIVEDAGTRVGRAQLDFSYDVVHVIDVALIAAARGKGIGKAVIRGIQRTAAVTGANVTLTCRHDNMLARQLYDKVGFELLERGPMDDRMIWYCRKII